MAGKTKKKWKRRGNKGQTQYKGRRFSYGGYVMASKSEVKFAEQLDALKIPWTYEEYGFEWVPPIATYKPDFNLTLKDGSVLHVEYKGFLRNEDKRKMIAMKLQRPDLRIVFIFENANKPVQGAKKRKDGSKMSHAEWAEKYGYEWYQGFLPDTLLKQIRR
jgi:hypothetical protein